MEKDCRRLDERCCLRTGDINVITLIEDTVRRVFSEALHLTQPARMITCLAVVICDNVVNTHTHTHTVWTSYNMSSAKVSK